MAAPARVAARTAKTLAEVATEIQTVKTGLMQRTQFLAERFDAIEAKLDQLLEAITPTRVEELAAQAEQAEQAAESEVPTQAQARAGRKAAK